MKKLISVSILALFVAISAYPQIGISGLDLSPRAAVSTALSDGDTFTFRNHALDHMASDARSNVQYYSDKWRKGMRLMIASQILSIVSTPLVIYGGVRLAQHIAQGAPTQFDITTNPEVFIPFYIGGACTIAGIVTFIPGVVNLAVGISGHLRWKRRLGRTAFYVSPGVRDGSFALRIGFQPE
jgi:hypothetical protein